RRASAARYHDRAEVGTPETQGSQPEFLTVMTTKALTVPAPLAKDLLAVAPALARYTEERLLGGVWCRPGLAMRDRSIVTVAALIARNHTAAQPYYIGVALDNGVTPREISEIITHLAF